MAPSEYRHVYATHSPTWHVTMLHHCRARTSAAESATISVAEAAQRAVGSQCSHHGMGVCGERSERLPTSTASRAAIATTVLACLLLLLLSQLLLPLLVVLQHRLC